MKVFPRLCCVIVGVLVVSVLGKQKCTDQTECNCGEVCVYKRKAPCNAGQSDCKCVRGCLLADQYFKPRESRRVYCNECFCNTNPVKGSFVGCTRRAWCELPTDYPLYHEQPACPDQMQPLRQPEKLAQHQILTD